MIKRLIFAVLLILLPVAAEAASVTWVCDRCTPASGTAVGTTSWSIANIGLAVGKNIITVIATDDQGGGGSDVIVVTFAPTFPGNTLAGSWGFEAGSGVTAVDSSGNSNTATLVSGTWATPGRYGNGITLDGINNSLIVPDANSLDYTQSFTISAWVKPAAVHTDFRAIAVKNYNLFFYASATLEYCPAVAGAALIGFRADDTQDVWLCSIAPLAIGQYSHVAGTYDGATLKLYVNGVLVSSKAASGLLAPTTGSFQIGGTDFGEYLNGDIDEVRTYNWAIPPTAGGNTSPGAACASPTSNVTAPSIVGDMNCQIIPTTFGPGFVAFKLGADTSPLKLGASAGVLKLGTQ